MFIGVELAPRKNPTVVETQNATAMATVEEQNTATNSKLDDLVEKMAKLTDWMQTVTDSTAELVKNTDFLAVRAEDTASRLGLLEANAATCRGLNPDPLTPTTTVVPTVTNNQPNGRR